MEPEIITQTKYVTTIDTLIKEVVKEKNIHFHHFDTVYINKEIIDTITITLIDTVRVAVPISKYVFEDSTYRAEISGFRVSLDKMSVYQRIVEKITPKQPKFVLYGGIGIGYSNQLRPELQVGVGVLLKSW